MQTMSPGWGRVVRLAALAGVLAVALVIPIPALSDHGRERVSAEVSERLPGWRIDRLDPSWEGAYTVVTSCAGRQLGFQFVPGHGLAPEDAWVLPTDGYSRLRLTELSDDDRFLVWYASAERQPAYSCGQELALRGIMSAGERTYD